MTLEPVSALERGRAAVAQRAWLDAFRAFVEADRERLLELDDLWLWARAAGLCDQEQARHDVLERIYQARLEAQPRIAAQAAFWLGFRLIHTEDSSRGQAWIGRAERALEQVKDPCVERGYLQLPRIRSHVLAGRLEEAWQASLLAIEVGEAFADTDLLAFTRCSQGRILVRQGQLDAGFKLLDEAMLAVTLGEVSPILCGLVYCAAIDVCQSVFELSRMRQWTASLSEWCAAQPQLVTFTGACLVCRAEILEVSGHWAEALGEAEAAAARYVASLGERAAGEAYYRQGEILRLRGELGQAEARFREASRTGRDPQPGLSLLRLAQGRVDAAEQALKSALSAARIPAQRAKLLPAQIEIALAARDVAAARSALSEFTELAGSMPTPVLTALSQLWRGNVELAQGDASASLLSLRSAFAELSQLDAPYWAARARLALACACQALDDVEGAQLELAAARSELERLGALVDVKAIDDLRARSSAAPATHGLTARELEVLRLVAGGNTNKLIASRLCLSEKTVDRHVSNILAKLGVPSRAAATAFAYENQLI